jgi:hypothetical protein
MIRHVAPTIDSAERAYAMLGSENVWSVARRCNEALAAAELPYAIIGGVAVCLHGYRRNTVDIDILVERDDAVSIRDRLEGIGILGDAENREFRNEAGIPIHLLFSREPAGKDRTYAVNFPRLDDASNTTWIEGLRVVTLPRLIEIKLACGLGDMRRTHRDLADVVELIAVHRLGRDFARHLHKSVRASYRKLVKQARGDESE